MTSVLPSIIRLVGAALVLFAATNLDDLLLLVVICSDLRRRYRPTAVLAGQVLGFSTILAISLLGYWSGLVIPAGWMACLGVLPLALGVRQLFALRSSHHGNRDASEGGFLGHPEAMPTFPTSWRRTSLKVAGLTLANGSDNVSVYLPLFGRLRSPELLITLTTFLISLLVLWFLAQWISIHRRWQSSLQVIGPILSPWVLITLGLWLLKDSLLCPLGVLPFLSS